MVLSDNFQFLNSLFNNLQLFVCTQQDLAIAHASYVLIFDLCPLRITRMARDTSRAASEELAS